MSSCEVSHKGQFSLTALREMYTLLAFSLDMGSPKSGGFFGILPSIAASEDVRASWRRGGWENMMTAPTDPYVPAERVVPPLPAAAQIPPSPPAARSSGTPEYFWLWVVCLLGLDYFSTLAYQPSVTYKVVGRLGPLATALVVLITLFGLLPVYCYMAGRSPGGHGSIGMLERLVRGWRGKTLVLVLLGFAATDFVMLKTISLADAAVHLRANQPQGGQVFHRFSQWCCTLADDLLPQQVREFFNDQMVVTLVLGVVGFAFWFLLRRGFNRNVIVLAVPLVACYLLLNAIVIYGG